MKDGIDHAEHLFDQASLIGRHGGWCESSGSLQLVLDFVQELAQELLRVLLRVASKRRDQLPDRVQHRKWRHQSPLS